MSKRVKGPAIIHQPHQFDTAAHLPLGEQFKAIPNQERLEAIRAKSECLEQIVTLTK